MPCAARPGLVMPLRPPQYHVALSPGLRQRGWPNPCFRETKRDTNANAARISIVGWVLLMLVRNWGCHAMTHVPCQSK